PHQRHSDVGIRESSSFSNGFLDRSKRDEKRYIELAPHKGDPGPLSNRRMQQFFRKGCGCANRFPLIFVPDCSSSATQYAPSVLAVRSWCTHQVQLVFEPGPC